MFYTALRISRHCLVLALGFGLAILSPTFGFGLLIIYFTMTGNLPILDLSLGRFDSFS